MAAALFLDNSISGLGKNVQIVAKGKIPEEFGQSTEKINHKIEPKKLIVSFNWRKMQWIKFLTVWKVSILILL